MLNRIAGTDNGSPEILGTLRGHLNSVTCMEFIYVPQQGCNTLKPTLLTTDIKGWIIWWDLYIKRPLGVWKGHDSNILTVKQLGLQWTGKGSPTVDSKVFGLVVTHSKDSQAKVWDLFKSGTSDVILSRNLAKKLPSLKYNELSDDSEELLSQYPVPDSLAIPVNTLNFCNIDIHGNMMITPNTMNSNNFDVYRIFDTECSRENILDNLDLKRISNNVDPWKFYCNQIKKNTVIDDDMGDDMTKRDHFGIMMRIAILNYESFVVGYESGHLVRFSINQESFSREENSHNIHSRVVINKDPKIAVVSINKQQYPNPSLSLEYSQALNKIISGSTGKNLIIQDLNQRATPNDLLETEDHCVNIKHNGVSSITIRNDVIGISFWDRVARIYRIEENELVEIDKIKKSLPRIGVDEKQENLKLKLNIIRFSRKPEVKEEISEKIRRRDQINMDRNYTCLGFEDGTVVVYNK